MFLLLTRRRPLHAGVILALLVAAVALTSSSGWSTSANADTLASKRAQARQVEAQIETFDMRLESTIQRYDGAVAHLHKVRGQISENRRQLNVAKHNLRSAKATLAQILVSTYKSGKPDPISYLLAAQSIQQLVGSIETQSRVTNSQADALAQIARSEHQISVKQRALAIQGKRASTLVSQAAAHKREVLTQLQQRRRLLASLNAGIRQLLQQQKEAEARAAAHRAAQAAAVADQPPPQTTTTPTTSTPPWSPGPVTTVPSPSSLGAQAVAIAKQYLGVPYVWGGATPSGFDCSGLTMYVYAKLGISLAHYTGDQWNEGVHVARNQLAPGDLVFFDNLGHEGMYIGGGLFIHAPHTGDVVKISSMSESWYVSNYDGAVRVTG